MPSLQLRILIAKGASIKFHGIQKQKVVFQLGLRSQHTSYFFKYEEETQYTRLQVTGLK